MLAMMVVVSDVLHEVPRRVFDGLLAAEGCALTPVLERELKALGFDPQSPDDWFTAETWRAAVDAVRRHVLPQVEREAGLVELGRRFAAGFGRTPVGLVFRGVAPLFGPDRTLLAVPRYLYTVRRSMTVAMHAEGPGRYRLVAEDRAPDPCFIGGCLLGILDIFSLPGRMRVVNVQGNAFEIELEWDQP
jgi:uncharacterized protein (TIGR02265 family)